MLKHKVIQNINDCLDLENISHDTNDSMTQACWSDVKSFINLIKTCLKILNIDTSTSTFGNTLDTVKTLNELEKKSLWDELENQTQVNQELILQAFDKVYKFYELWQQHQITTKQKDTNEIKANPGRQNSKSREAQIEIQKDTLQHELESICQVNNENTDQTMLYDSKILKDSKIPISENQFTQKQYKQMMISNNKESEQYDTDTQSIQFKIQQNHNEKSNQQSLNIETEKSYIPRFKICFNDFISKNNFINDNSTINMQQKDDSTWSSDEESQAFELQYKQLNIQPNTNRQMKNQNPGCNIQIQKEDPLPDMRQSNTGSQSDHLNNSGIHRVIANHSSVSQQIENNNPAQFRDSKIEILNTELNDQPNPNEHIISQQLLSNTPVQNQEQNSQLSNAKLSAEMQNTLKPITYNVSQNNNYHKQDQNDVQSTELEKAAEVQNNTIQRHNGMQDPLSVKVEQTNQIPQTHCNEPEQQIQLEINLSHHSQSPEKQPEPAIHIPTTQPSPSKNSVQTQAKFSQGLKYAILTLFSKDLEDKTDQQLIAFLNKNLNSQTVQKFWSIVELHSGNGSEYYQRQFMRCMHVPITQELKQQTITYLQSLNKLDQTEKQTMQLAKQIRKVVFKEQDVFLYDIIQIMLDNQSKYQVRKAAE
ncbi:Hypothetical_protein [Hexamita inflata]|uniref:Hypothetical_protein n=1 Tax=Hexamita inflata TaxID=28002 RepID=A0AA86NHI0_9EUKA|nr:Hypothetical protein HINF_LOCUS7192 [Hexamita inflata]